MISDVGRIGMVLGALDKLLIRVTVTWNDMYGTFA